MKKSIRILCLILAFSFLLPLAVACNGQEEKDGDQTSETDLSTDHSQDEVDRKEEALQKLGYYDEKEIVINLSKFADKEVPMVTYQYIQGPDEMTSDSVQNHIYDRNRYVADTIGVEPRYVYTNSDFDQVLPDIQTKVLAPGKNTPDLYIDQIYGLLRAQQSGFLKNAYDSGSKVDFTTEGWFTDYMNAFNFASEDKRYILAGDYTMDVILFLNTMGCNLSMFQNVFAKQGGTKLLYDTVEDGNWTLDKMMEWCQAAYADSGKIKGVEDQDDQLGYITYNGGTPSMGWMPALQVNLYQVEEGNYKVFPHSDNRSITAIDKILKLMGGTEGVLYGTSIQGLNSIAAIREVFVDGSALFISGLLLCTLETIQFQEMEDEKGIIPYPKLEATDEYSMQTDDCARAAGILISTEKFEETTAWLQAMALSSGEILDEYYNVALKFKYGTELGTTKMLDKIYDSIDAPHWVTIEAIYSDYGIVFGAGQHPISFWYARAVQLPATNTYVSNYAAVKARLHDALNSFKITFDRLN